MFKRISPSPVPHIAPSHNHTQDTSQSIRVISCFAISSPSPIDLDSLYTSVRQAPSINARCTPASLQIYNVRHIPPVVAVLWLRHPPTLRTRIGNGRNEVDGGEGLRRRTSLSVIGTVQYQNLRSYVWGCSDCFAYVSEYERRNNGCEQRPDAVDHCAAVLQGAHDAVVGRHTDLVAVWVDVPDSGDTRGEVIAVITRIRFGKIYGWLTQ